MSPWYVVGKKWSVAPESIAPLVTGYLSINTLQTFKAAGFRDGPHIRLDGNDTRSDLLLAFGVHGTSCLRYTVGVYVVVDIDYSKGIDM